jgi:hypothetical protein
LGSLLVRGGYPAVQRESVDRRAAWFASCISTILPREVRDLARVDGLRALPNLLKLRAILRFPSVAMESTAGEMKDQVQEDRAEDRG